MLNRLNKKLYKYISFDNDSNKIINNILLAIAKRYYNNNIDDLLNEYKFQTIHIEHFNIEKFYIRFIEHILNKAISSKLQITIDCQFIALSLNNKTISTPYTDYTVYNPNFNIINHQKIVNTLTDNRFDAQYINGNLYYRNMSQNMFEQINKIENLFLLIQTELNELNKIIK